MEELGYDYLLAYEHVLGAHPDRLKDLGRQPPYTHESPFHEPFLLFGFLAVVASRMELATGIVILPSGRPFSQLAPTVQVREVVERARNSVREAG